MFNGSNEFIAWPANPQLQKQQATMLSENQNEQTIIRYAMSPEKAI